MVPSFGALLGLLVLLSGPPADRPSPQVVEGAAATADARLAAQPDGVVASPSPDDGSGWLVQPAPAPSSAPLDLRRPRVAANEVPEAPHPASPRRRNATGRSPVVDPHLIRLTKDRGS